MGEENGEADRGGVTRLLLRLRDGDPAAEAALAPIVYAELKRRAQHLMVREWNGHSMQATMLVNDAYMALVHADGIDWESRGHFYSVAARVMRRLLVDRARSRARDKRGGGVRPEPFDDASMVSLDRDDDVLRVNEALERLAAVNERHAEIVTLRFFGGLGMDEIAEALGVPKRSLERDWTFIKAWLRRELSSER